METSKEILESRKKFAEKFGKETQIGGRGTERRKHPVKHRGNKVEVDKKIEAVAKKSQARKLNEVVEVNIFKDDNTVIQFKKPTVEYSFKEKVTFISGNHETKNLKDVFTNLVKQLGPRQLAFVKDANEAKAKTEKEKEKIDEAPELVEDFDEVAKEGKEKKKKKKAKKEKKDEETLEIIKNLAKIIDEKFLDFLLNYSQKPIRIINYFSCYIAEFTPEMLQNIEPKYKDNLKNVCIRFIILAKELYNTTMELFCSIYDLSYNKVDRFVDLAGGCGIQLKNATGLYKVFKDYSIILLEKGSFKDLKKTVEKFVEKERVNWDKIINQFSDKFPTYFQG